MLHLVMKNILISLVLPSVINGWFGNPQGEWVDYTAGVKGQLLCQGKGYAGAEIGLYDYYDAFHVFLNSSVSNNRGFFEISGTRKTPYTIKPKVFIHHKCLPKKDCRMEFDRDITSNYVRKSKDGHPYYNLGKMFLRLSSYRTRQYGCLNLIPISLA